MRPLFDQFLSQSSCSTEGSSGLFSTSHWNSSNTRMSLFFLASNKREIVVNGAHCCVADSPSYDSSSHDSVTSAALQRADEIIQEEQKSMVGGDRMNPRLLRPECSESK
jgi:hypothetical protein